MLFVIYGSDRLGVRERRDALVREHLPADGAEFALSRLDGQKCAPDELVRAVQALPFFGDRRVVLVDDLLSRFEPKRRRGVTGNTGAEGSEEEPPGEPGTAPLGQKPDPARGFAAGLGAVAPATTLILWERGTLSKTNPLLKVAAKAGTVEVYEAPKAADVEDWIFARARKKNVRLKPDVPRLLAEYLGEDLEVLDAELDKLSLFAGDAGVVDAGTVRLLTPQTRQAETLQLLNAASDHHPGEALSLLHELLANGVAPVAIIGMLGSQVRKLLQVQALAAQRVPAAGIAQRLGMHPYAARMAVESLRYHTGPGLRTLHRRLVETDQAVKTGQADGEAALELLVLDLARR